jgi:hypothetical protein
MTESNLHKLVINGVAAELLQDAIYVQTEYTSQEKDES